MILTNFAYFICGCQIQPFAQDFGVAPTRAGMSHYKSYAYNMSSGRSHACGDQFVMAKFHTRTIKLKLRVTDEDKAASWNRIRQISNDAWRAANWIAVGQLLNDQLVRRVYARLKIDPKDLDEVANVEAEFRKFFGTKRQATTERDIKEAFSDLPSCVSNPLNRIVFQSYNKEKQDMLSGNRSLRTYRKGMPVITEKKMIQFYASDDNKNHFVRWKLGRKEQINFGILYGRDRANHRFSIGQILKGELDYSAPSIQLKNKDLFLLLPVKDPQLELNLDPELSLGVDLGVTVPAYIALSKGPARRVIGSREDFLRVRLQMQARRRQLQRSLKSVGGGKGRQKKLRALKQLELKERNFARSYNHFISKEVIDFAVNNKAGVIKLEMLEGFGKEDQNAFILRNWSYFELQDFIQYKAKRVGIKVVKVDPYHTSQTCSVCGHYEEGQRKDRFFECRNSECGERLHADYNAALNIAQSDKIVTKKMQCEFYKKHKDKQVANESYNQMRGEELQHGS